MAFVTIMKSTIRGSAVAAGFRNGFGPRRLAQFALAALVSAGVLAAQRPEESWDNLNTLKAGQKIRVVRTNLKSAEGVFSDVSSEAITLRAESGQVTVARAEVFRVTLQEHSKRLRNALIGMAIGGGAALAIGAAVDSSASESDEHPTCFPRGSRS